MFRIPSSLIIGFVAFGLSLAVALLTSAAAQSVRSRTDVKMRTDVKIEAKDINVTGSPAAGPHPLTVRSLASAHAVEVHPYVATPDTEDTHSLRVESK
jgi:hypothetical protein